jgi:hypothetical protein
MGINDLLKRQPVGNLLINPNFAWSNDVLVSLIIGVNFSRKICLKSYIILQVPPLFTPWLQYKYKESVYPLECLFIFSLRIPLYLLLQQNEAMSALDQLRERTSKREAKLRK